METNRSLTDLERKLITIIQNINKKGESPSIDELEIRTGHNADDIQKIIKDLVQRKWLLVQDKKLVVSKKLF